MKNRLIPNAGIAILAILLFYGCGQSLDQSSGGDDNPSSTSLTLVWPEGYAYDQADNSLLSPISAKNRQAPDYVTDVILMVTGEDMEPIEVMVDTATLRATVDVTPGLRRFSVVVHTKFSDTFSGFALKPIIRGGRPNIVITLKINAPPTVEVTIMPANPKKGDRIILNAIVADPDPDDLPTITWHLSDPRGEVFIEHGPEVSDIVGTGGRYTARIVVDDQQGGVVIQDYSIFVPNIAPVIAGIIASQVYVNPGGTTTLTCDAFDADNDLLHYDWLINGNFFDSGRTILFTVPPGSNNFIISCEVTDDLINIRSAGIVLPDNFVSFDIEYHRLKAELSWTGTGILTRELDLQLTSPDGHTVPATSVNCGTTGSGSQLLIDSLDMAGFLPPGLYRVEAIASNAAGTCTTAIDETFDIKVRTDGIQSDFFRGSSLTTDATNTTYQYSFATNFSGATEP